MRTVLLGGRQRQHCDPSRRLGFGDVRQMQTANTNIDFSIPPVEGAMLHIPSPPEPARTGHTSADTGTATITARAAP